MIHEYRVLTSGSPQGLQRHVNELIKSGSSNWKHHWGPHGPPQCYVLRQHERSGVNELEYTQAMVLTGG